MLAFFGFQTHQLIRERSGLHTVYAIQDGTLQQAQRLRAQVDSILRSTFELAQKGNQGAAAIADQLNRRGITMTPGPAAPAPPATAPK